MTKALIFVDNFADSAKAFSILSNNDNITLVGFDRDYNFEIVSHIINLKESNIIDITELKEADIQYILKSIPKEIKNP